MCTLCMLLMKSFKSDRKLVTGNEKKLADKNNLIFNFSKKEIILMNNI